MADKEEIIKEFNVDPYITETIELTNLRVEGVFGKELEQQKSLNNYFFTCDNLNSG